MSARDVGPWNVVVPASGFCWCWSGSGCRLLHARGLGWCGSLRGVAATPRGSYWSSSVSTMKESERKSDGERQREGAAANGGERGGRPMRSLYRKLFPRSFVLSVGLASSFCTTPSPHTSFSLAAEGSSLVPLPLGRSPFVHTRFSDSPFSLLLPSALFSLDTRAPI